MAKIILASFNEGFFVRNFLRTNILRLILVDESVHLVLLVPADKLSYYRREFPHPNLTFDELPIVENFIAERFFKYLEVSSIHTHTSMMLAVTDFYRSEGKKFLARRILRIAFKMKLWWLGKFYCWRFVIRRAYFLIPSSTFKPFFKKYQPDLVYCPTMLDGDFRMLKEAKKAGLKTLGMMLSWDNLYSKTFLRVHPDWLLAHTDTIKKQAVDLGDYTERRIIVTGISQYDRFFNHSDVISRGEFIKNIGGDPAKRLIVYAFSGKVGLALENEAARALAEMIESGKIKNAQLLVRPHPRYGFPEDKQEKMRLRYNVLVGRTMETVGTSKDNWEFDDKSLKLLSNTLAHADVIISMYSTFFIEAAIFNKPLIAIGFDPGGDLPYWVSARRFFDWDHLREIGELDGIWRVNSREELLKAINFYLENPDHLKDGRKKIVLRQTQFTDGHSSGRVVNAILKLL